MIQLNNPYLANDYAWLKGNLHTHTTVSDGEREPAVVISDYEQRGYDFLSISDHDAFVVPADYQQSTKLILIPGVEVTAMGPHILQLGVEEVIEPVRDRQRVLDAIQTRGGMALFNHPNWEWHFNHFPQEMMEELQGATGVEVYNGVIERLEGQALASDRWDRLLSTNHWLWGFANDDSHYATDVGIAWNVVQVRERTTAAIMEAFRLGRFYASTGVVVDEIGVNGRTIRVQTKNAQRIRFVSRLGTIRATFDTSSAEWSITDNSKEAKWWRYVRVECYGAGGKMAWLQPMRIHEV